MAFGIVEYDQNGNPICEICKKSFKRVLTHVRQKHDINERDYKKRFGLDVKKGICSKVSSELSRIAVQKNYSKVVVDNLNKKGVKSQFKKGNKGRTKEQVSEQTRISLKNRIKHPTKKMKKAMIENGKKVGLSGLGNKKRWQDGK